ncbi:MAG TPA: hypothetical protein VHG52_09420 [Thermomicrobiales bacterium]|nr:hypothetical protein [Thermomicrobiales bacterium]
MTGRLRAVASERLAPGHRSDGRLHRGLSGWAGQCSLQGCEEVEHFGRFEDAVALFADVALDEYPGIDEAVDCGAGGDVGSVDEAGG